MVLTGGAVEDAPHAAAVAAKLRKLAEAGTRVVLCGRPPAPDTEAIALTFDNRGGARALTDHLTGLGHRRLGYIAGPEERTTTRHRLEGHRAALAAARIEEEPGWTVHGRYDRRSGYEATLELLRRDPSLTAIVAANDSRRPRRLRRTARVRSAHPRGRLGGRLRRPAVQRGRGAVADDGAAAAGGGRGPGRPHRHGPRGTAARGIASVRGS